MKILFGIFKNKFISNFIKKNHYIPRPTTSLIKKVVFNIIYQHISNNKKVINNTNFLDICCGTGIIGLEALSQGFKNIIFVDNNLYILFLMKNNFNFINKNNFNIIKININKLKLDIKFDIIFIDCPYKKNISILLKQFYNLISNSTLIFMECSNIYNIFIPISCKILSYKKFKHCYILLIKKKITYIINGK